MGGFEAVLQKYGKPLSVHRNGEEQIGVAMVQPLFEKGEQWLPSPWGGKEQTGSSAWLRRNSDWTVWARTIM